MKTENSHEGWSRRSFLAATTAGAGLVIVPSILGGCAKTPPVKTAGKVAVTSSPSVGYFAAFGIDDALIGRVLSQAMSRGGDLADLYFQHKISNFLGLQDGEVNRAFSEVELGCGVRVVKGDQTGFAFTEDLSESALTTAAKTAAVVADSAGSSTVEIARKPTLLPSYYPTKVPWTDVTIEKKIPLLESANAKALSLDKRIIKVQVYLSDSTSQLLLASSDGRIAEDTQPMSTAYVTCVAEHNGRREENYYSYGQRQGFDFYTPEKIEELAVTAARRTVILFDAEPPPAGEYPIVLAPGLSGILLHEAIGHGMEADFNRKGISVYADKIGKRIAPEMVTIVDDGTVDFSRGSINMDDEGFPGKRTVLVENGILTSYMHDSISAKHYGVETTANGRRESYQYPPVPRMRNTYMLNGPSDPEEIIKSVTKGIYAETFTNGQVRIGSGDFSFYLKNGYLIEDGKLTRPVKDANLIGFGPEVLKKVEMVGNDLAMHVGASTCGKDGQHVPVGMGLPTIKCRGISVGGVG
jgi:TldD protein